MSIKQSIASYSFRAGQVLTANQHTLAIAESCTGGWLSKTITDVSGSSAWFDRGFVTYSNQSKHEMLGVHRVTLERYGAVSEAVVAEMTAGALHNSHAQVAIAISGVAGPSGGTVDKPVGTVCFAWQLQAAKAQVMTKLFRGNRDAIREQAVEIALRELVDLYASDGSG